MRVVTVKLSVWPIVFGLAISFISRMTEAPAGTPVVGTMNLILSSCQMIY